MPRLPGFNLLFFFFFRCASSSLLLADFLCCCCCLVTSVVSDSVRPHGLQPTRLLRPWDSPGKNTGVGCHFLLQCMKVESGSEVIQSCLTLSNPVDCSLPGSSIHGIFQATVLEWGAIAFSQTFSSCSKRTISLLQCMAFSLSWLPLLQLFSSRDTGFSSCDMQAL